MKAFLKRDPVNRKFVHFWNNFKAVSRSVPLSWSHCQSDSFIVSFSYFEHIFFSHFWQKNLYNQPRKTSCRERTGNLVLELRRNTLKIVMYPKGEAGPQNQLYTKCCHWSTSGMCFCPDSNVRDSEPVSEFSLCWKRDSQKI